VVTSDPTAVVYAPEGVVGSLATLVDHLTATGIHVDAVADLGAAARVVSRTPEAPPCVLVDLRGFGETDATERLRKVVYAIPFVEPVAVTAAADTKLVIACIRSGASDVIDIQLEGATHVDTVVTRAFADQLERVRQKRTLATLRTMVEDMLKDLIKTERRSIDLEEKLAQFESTTGETRELGDQRPPSILLIEPNREVARQLIDLLQKSGVESYAFLTGEDACREVDVLLRAGAGFDLALVAAQLPTIDGLEAVRRLRDRLPGLPAFLMTAVNDADLAARAADLGVVGFVQKPLPDVDEIVARLAQLARDALARTREQIYLQRIKARHERVLARYRSLPRDS
jgi:CheY-like chemotaxis protein